MNQLGIGAGWKPDGSERAGIRVLRLPLEKPCLELKPDFEETNKTIYIPPFWIYRNAKIQNKMDSSKTGTVIGYCFTPSSEKPYIKYTIDCYSGVIITMLDEFIKIWKKRI